MTHCQWAYLQATAFTKEDWMCSLTLQIWFQSSREIFPQLFEDYERIGLVKNLKKWHPHKWLTVAVIWWTDTIIIFTFTCFFFLHMAIYCVFCHKDMREQLLQEFVLHIYHENNPRRRDLEFGFLGNLVETSLFPARYDSVSKITIH